jgi:hypothetical protein
LRRILLNSLYSLEVKGDGNSFCKIRKLDEREESIAKVQRNVKVDYSDVVVKKLGLSKHRGNVELYFKHRYRAFNYRLGLVN